MYLEYPGIEIDHHDAGDVEGPEGGVDDEVGVVKGTDELLLRWVEQSRGRLDNAAAVAQAAAVAAVAQKLSVGIRGVIGRW